MILAVATMLPFGQVAMAQNPTMAPAARTGEPDKVVRAYPVPNSRVDAILQRLTDQFPETSGVRITHDPRTGQILAIAPPAAQEQIAALIAAEKMGGAEPSGFDVGQPSDAGANAVQRGPKVVPLKHLNYAEFETELSGIFGKQMPVTIEHGGEWARYTLETRGGRVSMIVDRKANQVAMEGPVKLADAWAQVVESLDNHQQAGEDTKVVPLTTAKNVDVMKALSAVRDGGMAIAMNSGADGQRTTGTDNPAATNGKSGARGGGLVNQIMQPRSDGNDANAPANGAAQARGLSWRKGLAEAQEADRRAAIQAESSHRRRERAS